jgi:TPR repeat protein
LQFSELLTDDISALLVVLADQCRDKIKVKQTKHDQLNTKCLQLDTINITMKEKQEGLQKTVATMAKKVTAVEKNVVALEEQLVVEKKLAEDSKKEHDEAQTKLDAYNESVTEMKKVHRELSNEKELIASELGNINSMHEDAGANSSSSSSSSSSSVGSKRGRSSSSSSSSSRTSKRQKKDGTTMAEHAGQWLYEEGLAYRVGSKFKKEDLKRGKLMIEASASSGFPLAVAHCHYAGWNGMERDFKKGFGMFVKIEQETNGYHWAQHLLGRCYHFGNGTDQDDTEAVEWWTKSSEQKNSVAMCNLGFRYEKGEGCDQNQTKAVEWYEKSAHLGYSTAMFNLGECYEDGDGITRDVNQAREWYTKAAAQGYGIAYCKGTNNT